MWAIASGAEMASNMAPTPSRAVISPVQIQYVIFTFFMAL
jgi:hypothetical protein